jgi:hypothetical protein
MFASKARFFSALAALVIGAGLLISIVLIPAPTTFGLATDVQVPATGATPSPTASPTATPTRVAGPPPTTQPPSGVSQAADLPSAGSGGFLDGEFVTLPRALTFSVALFTILIFAILSVSRSNAGAVTRTARPKRGRDQ